MNGHEQNKIIDIKEDKSSPAPIGAAMDEEIRRAREYITEKPLFHAIKESVDACVVVLNSQRKVLALNKRICRDLQIDSDDEYVGHCAGEIIGCIHGQVGQECGSAPACKTCGLALTISECMDRKECVQKECAMDIRRDESAESQEYLVSATPVSAEPFEFIVIIYQNNSAPKRREALERAFFHDVLNTVGGLLGWSKMLQQYEGVDPKQVANRIWSLSNRLCNEVQDQRRLTQAEKGDLMVCLEKAPISQIFLDLQSSFLAYDDAEARTLDIEHVDSEEQVVTDISLLLRILVNMLKNAAEASRPGDTIRVWREWRNGAPVFCVQNPGMIPHNIASQIFRRSFTTKGSLGRGIGTFSMKLFGEKYLKGKVGFETGAEKGTIFSIQLPACDSSEDWESIDQEECNQS